MSRFDLSLIEAGLSTYLVAKSGQNEIWDEIVSTNDRAIELALNGAEEGTLVLARKQTAGRGRQGRTWVSPRDAGIFMSFIFRPKLEAQMLPLFSFVAAVAAATAIENVTGTKIGLKWVNDLVYGGKKLGGILAEMPGSQRSVARPSSAEANEASLRDGAQSPHWLLPPALILGMGMNLSLEGIELPAELQGKVESLDNICGGKVDANQIVAELCNSLEEQYNHLRHSTPELVIDEWKKYSHTLGKRIRASVGNEELEGTASDITPSGALVLTQDDGSVRILHAGEISIRMQDGTYS